MKKPPVEYSHGKLEAIYKELTEKVEKEALKQEYEDKISQVQGQIDTLNNEIRTLDEEIAQKQKEIEGPQKEIDENMELLKQRIRAIYMAGETSTLDIIPVSYTHLDVYKRQVKYSKKILETVNFSWFHGCK